LPISLLRSRGFRVLQSFSSEPLGTVSPWSLPFCPWCLPGSRVFRFRSAGLHFYNPDPPLLHFDATLSVLPPRLPPPYTMSGVDRRPPSESTSRKLLALRHSKIEEPLLSSPFEDVRRVGVLSRGTVPRVWLPSLRPMSSPIRGSLFQPPTPLGFALQSFTPHR
jgi:hypothetical protein